MYDYEDKPMLSFFIKSWAINAIVMTGFWGVYMFFRNPGVVDVGWVLSIALIGVLSFLQLREPSVTHVVLLLLLIFWAVRLGGFLFLTRIVPAHIDGRYVEIKNSFSSTETINYFINYQVQALLAAGIAFCLHFVFKQEIQYGSLVWFSVLIIVIGILGEALADYQLYEFKQTGNTGICDVGFWKYSRHPNYFFEIVTWLGFALAGVAVSGSFWGLISPLLLWWIMDYITVPLTERVSLSKRPEYAKYIEKTNKFIPYPLK